MNDVSQNKNKGILIGGIVGAILLLVIIGIVLFFVLKDDSSPKAVAKNYVEYLIKGNYDNAFKLVDLPEGHFVESADYYNYIKGKSYFNSISEKKIKNVEKVIENDTSAIYNVFVKDKYNKEGYFAVNLILNSKKEWKVDEESFYISDWSLEVPLDTTLYINGKKIDEKYKTETNLLTYKYTFPAISKSSKKFKLENKLGNKEYDITPLSSNSGEYFSIELTDKNLTQKAYDYIKNTWNNMYKDYKDNVDVGKIKEKYFDDNVDVEAVKKYYTDSFNSITKGSSSYKCFEHVILEVIDRKNSSNYVSGSDIITLNFGYKLSWKWDFNDDVREMKKYSHIRLKIVGDSFKIYDVTDAKLFSYANHFTKDY